MRGYSQHIIEANASAEESVGTKLGKVCIEQKIPASLVAQSLEVSRQTVYDWFTGKTKPIRAQAEKIEAFIAQIM